MIPSNRALHHHESVLGITTPPATFISSSRFPQRISPDDDTTELVRAWLYVPAKNFTNGTQTSRIRVIPHCGIHRLFHTPLTTNFVEDFAKFIVI
jgi:hypothetical protein